MSDTCAEILGDGLKILRKYQSVRRGYRGVRYAMYPRGEAAVSHNLSVYAAMRLQEYTAERVYEGDGAVALQVLHGAGSRYELPSYAIGSVAGAYHYLRRHYRIGEGADETLLARSAERLMREQPRTATGVICLPGERLRVDMMVSVAAFLAMSGVVLGRADLCDEAVRQVWGLSEELYDAESGLYAHARNWFRGDEVSGVGWGRGSAYAVLGLVEVLRYLPESHGERQALTTHAAQVLGAVAKHATKDGMYRQDLRDEASYEESSATALIVYALASAVREGWIGGEYREAAEQGWRALLATVELSGNVNVRGTSVSTEPMRTIGEYRTVATGLNDENAFGPLMLAAGALYESARSREWDRPVESAHRFTAPEQQQIRAFFTRCHESSERGYRGDGGWGTGTIDDPEGTFDEIIKESQTSHPIVRYSAFSVMGYTAVLVSGSHEAVYDARAKEGLEWLVRNQEPDGSFRLWTRREGGQADHDGCLFDTGLAGSALVSGYEYTRDPAYLAASARAAEWECEYPIVANTNFNAFAVWHLARQYEVSGDARHLEAAVHRARYGMLPAQQPSGGWLGHNAMVWYHGINVRAYATLLRVLPERHRFRGELEPALRASVNHVGTLQLPDGSLYYRPGVTDICENYSEIIAGLVESDRVLRDPAGREILDGVVAYRISPASGDPNRSFNQEKGVWLHGWSSGYVYAFGEYAKLHAGRDR